MKGNPNSGPRSKIRVLIADDHAILRSGLRMLINSQPDMEVVAEAEDGNQAIEKCRTVKPDVAIVDVTMPNSGGLKSIGEMTRRCRTTRVLVLTMHSEPAYLRTALAAGALGYVLKKSVDADLLSAIRAVHQSKTYVDPELADHLVRDALRGTGAQSAAAQRPVLSTRESQVLKMVAEGFSSKEIAAQIFVSTKTVETYRARIAEKLGLDSRAALVRYALESGVLSTDKLATPGGRPPARREEPKEETK
ncbi:MAG TPA: response regulator transcription factor [Candidatus Angelobacter sp.]|nr:response regulator transcription factor [Candidatus Angelobacter sp.]